MSRTLGAREVGRNVLRTPRWRARWSVLALAAAASMLTGCLQPGQPDPTGHAPFGNLELNAQSGLGVRVAGWAIDPDTTAPVDVHVKVEGVDLQVVRADRSRPDVGAVYPGWGSAHGFDLAVDGLGPGKRQVCVWVPDVGAGGDTRVLGCRDIFISVEPFGNLESVTTAAEPGRSDGTVRVSGWNADPETSAPTDVAVLLDGRKVLVQPTDVERPDVAAAFGLGSRRGFDITFPAPLGRHTVCVVIGNVGWGAARFLGCSDVVVQPPSDRRPDLRLASVVPVDGSAVRIRGTASDPDAAGPITVHARVDLGPLTTTTTTAGSFDLTVSGLGPGRHEVCLRAVDVPGASPGLSGDRTVPCSSFVLGAGAPNVATTGAAATSVGVGPPAGSPLHDIDRDAGVSVTLRDGSTLWLFGDSSAVDANGDLRYFVNNTAAWAAAGAPTVTRDAVAVGGVPVRFIGPDPGWSCPPTRPNAAMWPMSAVATPSGSNDLVTVFVAKVCIGPGFLNLEPHGVAVVRWTYDPARPPAEEPIVGTILTQDLFPTATAYGEAAVAVADSGAGAGDDGWYVYAYQCASPVGDGPFFPAEFGPCTVGRVPVAAVGTRSAWRFWNGGSWEASSAAAAPVLPGGGADPDVPVAAFTVSRDPVFGLYVMVYSPWPGFVDKAYVRVSSNPVGPWSRPVVIQLPGCSDPLGSSFYSCYAASAQPRLSANAAGVSSIGLGWYDRLVSVGPTRGSYRASSVPFSVQIP